MRLDDKNVQRFTDLVDKADLIELRDQPMGGWLTSFNSEAMISGYQFYDGMQWDSLDFKDVRHIHFSDQAVEVRTNSADYRFEFFRRENLIRKTSEDQIREHYHVDQEDGSLLCGKCGVLLTEEELAIENWGQQRERFVCGSDHQIRSEEGDSKKWTNLVCRDCGHDLNLHTGNYYLTEAYHDMRTILYINTGIVMLD